MRALQVHEAWETIEEIARENPLAISIFASALKKSFEFSEEQAQAAAGVLARSTRDPEPERQRLLGKWESSRQQGVPGLGGYRWDLDQYSFQPDYTYVDSFRGLSGVQTPSTNPVQVTVGPGLTSSSVTGVYLVGVQGDHCELCLCSAHTGVARVRRVHFRSPTMLYIDGLVFKRTW